MPAIPLSARDDAALSILKRLRRIIRFRLVRHKCNNQEHLADDLASDALVSVLEAIKRNGQMTPEHFARLIHVCARRAIADYCERNAPEWKHREKGFDAFEFVMQPEHEDCKACNGTGLDNEGIGYCCECDGDGHTVVTLPPWIIRMIGEEKLQVTAIALSKGLPRNDTARLLEIQKTALRDRILKLATKLWMLNPAHDQLRSWAGIQAEPIKPTVARNR